MIKFRVEIRASIQRHVMYLQHEVSSKALASFLKPKDSFKEFVTAHGAENIEELLSELTPWQYKESGSYPFSEVVEAHLEILHQGNYDIAFLTYHESLMELEACLYYQQKEGSCHFTNAKEKREAKEGEQ